MFPGMYSHRPLVVYGGPSKDMHVVQHSTVDSDFYQFQTMLPIQYTHSKGIGKNMVSGQTLGIYTGSGQSVQMEVLADLYRMWPGCM